MTIGVIAKIPVQDGKGPEFEAFFTELAKQVRANEPGNLAYQLTKSRTEPNVYKVLELYKDQDALTVQAGHIFLCHQVHSITQWCDQSDVCDLVKC